MATVTITLNQLAGRDQELARRFEREIREAAASAPDCDLGCRSSPGKGRGTWARRTSSTVEFHHQAG